MKHFLYKNTSIAYSDSQIGEQVIVFLHGFLENSSMWDTFLPELTKNKRVICIDLLGHGKTDCLGYIHTMEENATVVYSVLQFLQIDKATIIGHSMGGYVALAFAEKHPANMEGLILLNSTAIADSEERKANRDRAILAVKLHYKNAICMSVANLFSEENRTKLVNEIDLVKKEALKTPIQGIIASQEGMKLRKDRQFVLQNANYPTFLVLGRKDPVLDYETTKNQIENTNTQLITFADGHMSTIENKTELLLFFIKTFTVF